MYIEARPSILPPLSPTEQASINAALHQQRRLTDEESPDVQRPKKKAKHVSSEIISPDQDVIDAELADAFPDDSMQIVARTASDHALVQGLFGDQNIDMHTTGNTQVVPVTNTGHELSVCFLNQSASVSSHIAKIEKSNSTIKGNLDNILNITKQRIHEVTLVMLGAGDDIRAQEYPAARRTSKVKYNREYAAKLKEFENSKVNCASFDDSTVFLVYTLSRHVARMIKFHNSIETDTRNEMDTLDEKMKKSAIGHYCTFPTPTDNKETELKKNGTLIFNTATNMYIAMWDKVQQQCIDKPVYVKPDVIATCSQMKTKKKRKSDIMELNAAFKEYRDQHITLGGICIHHYVQSCKVVNPDTGKYIATMCVTIKVGDKLPTVNVGTIDRDDLGRTSVTYADAQHRLETERCNVSFTVTFRGIFSSSSKRMATFVNSYHYLMIVGIYCVERRFFNAKSMYDFEGEWPFSFTYVLTTLMRKCLILNI